MAFQYEPVPEELAAAALLRGKGWKVRQPFCPECGGWGDREVIVDGYIRRAPCSLGCWLVTRDSVTTMQDHSARSAP